MGSVTIGRSPSENPPEQKAASLYYPISKFKQILEDYARIWDINIIAEWPETCALAPAHGDSKSVTLHFFHEKMSESRAIGYTIKNSVLGHVCTEEIRCVFVTVPNSVYRIEFNDFDDSLLAHVQRESIYIDFDFLRTCWDGHEDVLRIILAWGLAQLMVMSFDVTERADRFTEYVKALYAEMILEERKKFVLFQQDIAKKAIAYYEQELLVSVRSSIEYEAAHVEATRQLEEFIALDLDAIDEVERKQFEADFDRLRHLVGVAKIKIANGRIFVATNRLEQVYPPPALAHMFKERTKEYDVGSIEFSIDPLSEQHAEIDFRTLVAGAYRNTHFTSSVICLGSNAAAGGMNFVMDKLLVKCKIPDVVASILTFFRVVNMRPTPSSNFNAMEQMQPLRDTGRIASVFSVIEYAETDWKQEKPAYVALMENVVRQRGKKEREKVLNDLRSKQTIAFSNVKRCWEAAADLERVRRHVVARFMAIEARAHLLLDALEKHSAVLGFDMHNDGLRIWFRHDSVFKYPSILWIQKDGVVRLVQIWGMIGCAKNHVILWDWNGRKRPTELVARGEYAELVSHVMDVMSNWLAQMSSDFG